MDTNIQVLLKPSCLLSSLILCAGDNYAAWFCFKCVCWVNRVRPLRQVPLHLSHLSVRDWCTLSSDTDLGGRVCGWCKYNVSVFLILPCGRADSRFVPSQWETALQSNAVSHWLGAKLESALCESYYPYSDYVWKFWSSYLLTEVCVVLCAPLNWGIIGSGDGLSLDQHQAINWINDGWFSTRETVKFY